MKYGTQIEKGEPQYEDIHMPKNTPMGIYIAGFSFLLGFSLIWHIMWLIPLAFIGIITCVLMRSFDYDTDYYVPAAQVKKIEEHARAWHTAPQQ